MLILRGCRRRSLLSSGLLYLLAGSTFCFPPAASLGQTLAGPELHVNSIAKNVVGGQRVGFTTNGEFLVVWEQVTPDGKAGLWGQWFSPTGQPLGGNRLLRVTKSQPYGPVTATGAQGGVLVLWAETHSTSVESWETAVGGELLPDGSWLLRPHNITSLWALLNRFASPLPQGGYAITVLGTRLTHLVEDRTFLILTDDNLNVVLGPSPVSPSRQTSQEVGGLAVSSTGDFLVTWTEAESTILAQIFSPAGRPWANAFKVPQEAQRQYVAAAAPLGDKGYVVVWQVDFWDRSLSETIPELRMRLLKPDGTPQGPELRLDPEIKPRAFQEVASDAAGNFLVVWLEEAVDGPHVGTGVWGRLFHPDGTPYGPKVRLNQKITYSEADPQVAASSNGTFVVVWHRGGPYSEDDGIYGRVVTAPPSGR